MFDAYMCSWSWYTWPWCTYVIYMMHDACIYTWSWYMHVWCMYMCPSILDPDTCIHVWCIHLLSVILTHVCMMDVFMMRHICHAWTNLDSDAYIHDACMHDAYTYAPWSLCICAWCINVWCIHPWSLILDYAACVCMMHISMILDLDPEACMYVWCMYLWCGKFCYGRTDERTRRF